MQDKQFKKMPGYADLRRYVSWHARNFNTLQGTLLALLRSYCRGYVMFCPVLFCYVMVNILCVLYKKDDDIFNFVSSKKSSCGIAYIAGTSRDLAYGWKNCRAISQ